LVRILVSASQQGSLPRELCSC